MLPIFNTNDFVVVVLNESAITTTFLQKPWKQFQVKLNILIYANRQYTHNSKNFVMNYKNMVSFKSKLPKLRFNKNSVITNK